MIFVVARSQAAYTQWMRANFPNAGKSAFGFIYVNPLHTDQFRSAERDSVYFNVDHAKLPDWFVQRFKLVRLV